MTRNRVGRPSLEASRARSHRVATFVTQNELETTYDIGFPIHNEGMGAGHRG